MARDDLYAIAPGKIMEEFPELLAVEVEGEDATDLKEIEDGGGSTLGSLKTFQEYPVLIEPFIARVTKIDEEDVRIDEDHEDFDLDLAWELLRARE